MYDQSQEVREKAIQSLLNFCDYLNPTDRGDYVLKFILQLAHEEDD